MQLLVHFVIYGHSCCFESSQIAQAVFLELSKHHIHVHKSPNAQARDSLHLSRFLFCHSDVYGILYLMRKFAYLGYPPCDYHPHD